jgi:hypothetical protein
MMLGSARGDLPQSLMRPVLPRSFKYAVGSFDQEVIADETGRIVAGDPGQATVDQWLASKNLIPVFDSPPFVSNFPPNYAAYAALALVAFLALRGLR